MIVLNFNNGMAPCEAAKLPEIPESKPRSKWTRLLILAGVSTTLGSSLQVGYNIGVVNSPADIIKTFCNESVYTRYGAVLTTRELDILWSSIVSVFLIGGATGSLTGSWVADKLGRKGSIITSSGLSLLAGIMFFISKSCNSVELLIFARLIVGLSGGLVTCSIPMYLTELAPIQLRGAMGVLCPLGVTSGVLLSQILSLQYILGTEHLWPYLLAFYMLPVVIGAIAIPFLPESPKYLLIIRKKPGKALKQLSLVRNVPEAQLDIEIKEMHMSVQQSDDSDENWNIGKVLRSRELLLPLLLVCSMQAGQQLSGINAVFYYSGEIFKTAGLTEMNRQLANIGAGIINLLMAIVSIEIMSRFKRRSVMQFSCFSSAICLVTLGATISCISLTSWMPFLCILAVLGYVLLYGIGLGPIPYFVGSELFEVGPRPSAMALGSMANWGGNFLVGMSFPTLQSYIGAASFVIFAGFTLFLFLFIRKYMPETKGRDPADIAQICKNGLRSRVLESPINSSSTADTLPVDVKSAET